MSDDEQLASKTEKLSVGEKKMTKKDAKKAAKKAAFDNEVRAMGGKVDGDVQEDPDEREREYSIAFSCTPKNKRINKYFRPDELMLCTF